MKHKMLFVVCATLITFGFVMAFDTHVAYAAGCTGANIIFSEIDYDQPGIDNAEFIELFIPNDVTISNCEIRRLNGSTPTNPQKYGDSTDISGTYTAGTYIVIGGTGIAGRDFTFSTGSACATDCLQNGANDAFALVDTSGAGTLVWLISYEGEISNYNPGDGSSNTSQNLPVSEGNTSPNNSIINGPTAGIADATNTTDVTPGSANLDNNGDPNAITLTDFTASSARNTALLASLALIMLGVGAAVLRRRM